MGRELREGLPGEREGWRGGCGCHYGRSFEAFGHGKIFGKVAIYVWRGARIGWSRRDLGPIARGCRQGFSTSVARLAEEQLVIYILLTTPHWKHLLSKVVVSFYIIP